MKRYSLLVALTILMNGCVEYRPTPPPLPEVTSWKTPQNKSTTKIEEKWWTLFHDNVLTRLEEEALKNNPTLMLQVARIQEAEGFYGAKTAEQLPQLNLNALARRERLPASLNQDFAPDPILIPVNPPAKIQPLSIPFPSVPFAPTIVQPVLKQPSPVQVPVTIPPPVFQQHVTTLRIAPELSYEADFWGKFANAAKAANEQVKASEYALKTSILLLTTSIAEHYFQLRVFDRESELIALQIKARETEETLHKARFEAGLDSEIQWQQTAEIVAELRSERELFVELRAIEENALAALVGVPASTFRIEKMAFHPELIAIQAELQAELPAEVLEARPDIQQALHEVEAARHTVGVAKAAFFPSITISGLAGYQSDSFSSLFKWKNRILAGTGTLFQPLFDGGKLRSELAQAKALYEQAVASLLDKVIVAYQEVENALGRGLTAEKRHRLSRDQLLAASRVHQLVSDRWKAGLIDLFPVLDAETERLAAERTVLQFTRNILFSRIALVRSIGGASS